MNQLLRISAVAVLAAPVLFACAQKKDAATPDVVITPLSTMQKTQLENSVLLFAEATEWQIAGQATPGSAAKADLEKDVSANCTAQSINKQEALPAEPGSTTPGGFKTQLGTEFSGNQCPITMGWLNETVTSFGSQSGGYSSAYKFSIKYSPAAWFANGKVLIDVQDYRLNYSQTESVPAGSDALVMSGSGSGSIVSQKLGTIGITISRNGTRTRTTNDSSSVMRLFYPNGLVVEVKEILSSQNSTGQARLRYYLNTVEQSEKDLLPLLQSLGLDKIQSI